MGAKFFLTKISRAREAPDKSRSVNPDLSDSRGAAELEWMGAAAWWNTCGMANLVLQIDMTRLRERAGERHGRLTVIKRGPSLASGMTRWWCECECGRACVLVSVANLGRITFSCGCLAREKASRIGRSNKTHGASAGGRISAEYRVWKGVKDRCLNASATGYADYGGRGIGLCKAWQQSFEAFLRDMGPMPGPCYSIERLDNNGNYEPANCVWATPRQQARNRRTTVWVRWQGETLALPDAAERAGLTWSQAWRRMRRGVDFIRVEVAA